MALACMWMPLVLKDIYFEALADVCHVTVLYLEGAAHGSTGSMCSMICSMTSAEVLQFAHWCSRHRQQQQRLQHFVS